ncbi:MAG: helix-turn-helix domain-containing protein [Lachnospiraceae bacterium]|jgi:two-component system response regulator YesN|nr:helix-turn-helix domain-containing protein [Lachnospiraceae bacterium]
MKYETEINFVKTLLGNFHLSFVTVESPLTMPVAPFDFGLRQLLLPDFKYPEIFERLEEVCHPNTIYRVEDFALCYYIFFRIPDVENLFAIIGPYTLTVITPDILLKTFGRFSYPPETILQLEKYYQEVPLLRDESTLFTILYTLGTTLWKSEDNFSLQDIADITVSKYELANAELHVQKPVEPFLSMKVLEKRYADENELIKAVASGQIHKADVFLNAFSSRQMEQRLTDSLRDKKNYTIVLNTLLRKAAESAAVHPLYIDRISTKYAKKIELCVSPKAVDTLSRDMIHNYCLLVQNHSMKGYSLLIQKVLTQIDSDLTADLSLNSQARLLNVNSSYLSTLFKKETGSTLTEYVNGKRIKHAVSLLNTTSMQIQAIAQYCGIPDVNYFTKTFKKYIGTTPKEYRDSIREKAKNI